MKIKIKINEAKSKTKDSDEFATKEFSRYELDDMDTDRAMVELLTQVLAQLKTLVHYSTPAKDIAGSEIEKAAASAFVAERIAYHLKSLNKGEFITLE